VLYEMKPPHKGHRYVVASAVIAPFSGAETYLFPADAQGEITDWDELPGSIRGTLEHGDAIEAAGYEVA